MKTGVCMCCLSHVFCLKPLAAFWIRTPPGNRTSFPLGQLHAMACPLPQSTRSEVLSALGLGLLTALWSPSEEYKIKWPLSSPRVPQCCLLQPCPQWGWPPKLLGGCPHLTYSCCFSYCLSHGYVFSSQTPLELQSNESRAKWTLPHLEHCTDLGQPEGW